MPVGVDDADKVVEAWNPYRTMFDVVWSGRRHVMMGASARSTGTATRTSRSSATGRSRRRSCSASAARRATRSTTPRATGSRTTRRGCSCAKVDVVSGVGYDRAAAARRVACGAPRDPPRRHQPRACSTSRRPTTGCACARVHPGVTVDEVVAATGFELVVAGDVPETRLPTDEELALIREVIDPNGLARPGGARLMHAALHTRSATSFGVDVPDRADRHGLGRRARLAHARPRAPAGSASSPAPR